MKASKPNLPQSSLSEEPKDYIDNDGQYDADDDGSYDGEVEGELFLIDMDIAGEFPKRNSHLAAEPDQEADEDQPQSDVDEPLSKIRDFHK